ncbi:MAG: hypothetical protein JWM47_4148 [Acidimicrobiales bacterium]|nr:hypothetical protein [Acidimicrobiales bacterium]
MNVLLVGAGAVGQVYGFHLKRGGARVSFFVRPKYVDECRRGFKLYPLNRRAPRRAPVSFEGSQILSTLEEVKGGKWDQVYLCMSSTGLRGSPGREWFPDFARAIGDKCTLVTLQPGLEDREYILKHFPEDRLVAGMISLISYHAPLPGEKVPEPGMAYWFPPLSPSPFSGSGNRPREVAGLLRAGSMPTAVHKDVPRDVAFPSAALTNLLSALEAESWSFKGLARSPRLALAVRGAQEVFALVTKKTGATPPIPLRTFMAAIMRFLLKVAPKFVPLDLETYFQVHFTKVGDQTRLSMREYIEQARTLGLPTGALTELLAGLRD